jgi:hypothetical protein
MIQIDDMMRLPSSLTRAAGGRGESSRDQGDGRGDDDKDGAS